MPHMAFSIYCTGGNCSYIHKWWGEIFFEFYYNTLERSI